MELLAIILVLATLQLCYTAPITIHKDARYSKLEKSHPSHIRKVQLYSRQGFFLAIYENGTVGATTVRNSPDAILEMESFSVTHKRIRRPNSFYLAIDKNGKIRTRHKQRADTFFIEHHNGNYLWYENSATGFIFAMKRNGSPKDKVKRSNKHKRKTHFLIMGNPS